MKTPALILTAILIIASGFLFSQNAPVTTVSSVINPVVGSVLTVPVKVSNFSDISRISLVLDYNPVVLTLIGGLPNPSLSGFSVDGTTTPGEIIASWSSLSGYTLGDETSLLIFSFKYNGGTSGLTWNTWGNLCQYAKYNGGLNTVLNDLPKSVYYINGAIANSVAPITFIPKINVPPVGPLDIPILVTGFNDIGAISLTLGFDPSALVYQDIFTPNSTLAGVGTWYVGSQDSPDGKKFIRISWIRNEEPAPPPVNLPDSSTLITLQFNYLDQFKSSELTWIEDEGSACEYSDGSYNIMSDFPSGTFYQNGAVSGSLQGPVIKVPTCGASPNMDVTLPVTVSGFKNVGSFTLRLDYTSETMTFLNAEVVSLPPDWILNSSLPVAGRLILSGTGVPATLGDSSVMLNLKFHFQGGSSLLNWYDSDNISCIVTDAVSGLTLFDRPQQLHYINGNIITCNCP
jgi:hypothetical protein